MKDSWYALKAKKFQCSSDTTEYKGDCYKCTNSNYRPNDIFGKCLKINDSSKRMNIVQTTKACY